MLEIYNEIIRDFLLINKEVVRVDNGVFFQKYVIKYDVSGNIYVVEFIVVDVRSSREVFFFLDYVVRNR